MSVQEYIAEAGPEPAKPQGWLGLWMRFGEGMSAFFFAVMFIGFMIQIISRYVFNFPISWSLELCSIAYVWVVFWSSGILVSERKHILFDLLYNRFPPRARRVVAIVNTATLGLIFLAAMPGVVDYVLFLGRRTTMLLKLPMDLVYSCFVIFMLAVVIGAAIRVRRLLGREWQAEL
ncbi:MAG: TRAP transporter small permease [Mesorhizobium sp.]|nr:TRAP transporter small permease [Mesorhizobium sp.]MBL8577677.1 TRAP transporter small permease [Mesorhizobium sp.]